ncbi:uncharacterized protein LOC143838858 [Paroedura picta]|uniref:uncharacterized protein LOC143838858 n=1 Tax=Paroedura picta TaxID=143630 RepID=UPI004055DC9C
MGEAHDGELEGHVKSDAQQVVNQVKALIQKEEQLTLQEITKLLKEVNVLAVKVDSEVSAYVTKLQKELEAAARALLLKYLTQLESDVTQLQALTTTVEGQVKADAQQLLSQIQTVLQKGATVTVAELTKIEAALPGLIKKLTGATAEAFKKFYQQLQTVINAEVQRLLSQVEGYLNQVQAYVVNLEGQAKVRAEQLLTQWKNEIKVGQTVSVQLLTNIANGINKISQDVDKVTAQVFNGIISHLQAIIKSLQPAKQ